jgi:hypothetical protein
LERRKRQAGEQIFRAQFSKPAADKSPAERQGAGNAG